MKLLISLLILLLCSCTQHKIDGNLSSLVLHLTNDNKIVQIQDTGIPFKGQETSGRIFRNINVNKISVIDLSREHYIGLQVYQGQPCAAKPAFAVVDCFTDDGVIFQRFGMGRGQGPGEMASVNRFALNDSGYAMLSDVNGNIQKLVYKNVDELIYNVGFPLEGVPETMGSAGYDRFAYTNSLFISEPSIIYFEKIQDGLWKKINGSNLYDQSKPLGPSKISENPRAEISRDLIGVPNVFMGMLDGHSDGDFILSTMYSGLLVRMDQKKASWVRNLITNPLDGSIEMERRIPNLPEEYRPAYSPPMYYLPKLLDRQFYTYGLSVQNGHIINIDIGENSEGEKGIIFDFYREDDGTYLHSYQHKFGISLTYLGIQLSGNRLYILNGDGEILIFELTFG